MLTFVSMTMWRIPVRQWLVRLFPTDNVVPTAAVMEAMQTRTSPANPESLAAAFRQGRRILPQKQAVLASLLRFGFVATQDGGRTYALRRAA